MNRFRALIAALALLAALIAIAPPAVQAQPQGQPLAVANGPSETAWWSPVLGFLARLWSGPESPPATGVTTGGDGEDTTPSFDPDGLAVPPHPETA